jgi:hypothetical protein
MVFPESSRKRQPLWSSMPSSLRNVAMNERVARVLIALLVGAVIYAAVAILLGSWLWIGVAGAVGALMGAAADRLIRAQRQTTPPREPIRIPPIPPTRRFRP